MDELDRSLTVPVSAPKVAISFPVIARRALHGANQPNLKCQFRHAQRDAPRGRGRQRVSAQGLSYFANSLRIESSSFRFASLILG